MATPIGRGMILDNRVDGIGQCAPGSVVRWSAHEAGRRFRGGTSSITGRQSEIGDATTAVSGRPLITPYRAPQISDEFPVGDTNSGARAGSHLRRLGRGRAAAERVSGQIVRYPRGGVVANVSSQACAPQYALAPHAAGGCTCPLSISPTGSLARIPCKLLCRRWPFRGQATAGQGVAPWAQAFYNLVRHGTWRFQALGLFVCPSSGAKLVCLPRPA